MIRQCTRMNMNMHAATQADEIDANHKRRMFFVEVEKEGLILELCCGSVEFGKDCVEIRVCLCQMTDEPVCSGIAHAGAIGYNQVYVA